MAYAEQEMLDKVWLHLKLDTGNRDILEGGNLLESKDPAATPLAGPKEQCLAEIELLRLELELLQEKLHAQATDSLLIVLQGLDASGKDGTVRKVFDGVNPQGVTVEGFRAPTEEELKHDFLWRVHSRTPYKGAITIFNRSHYEDLIVPCAYRTRTKEELHRIRDEIEHFEALLHANGTRIVRIFLNISKQEQTRRFLERIEIDKKHWKFSAADLVTREHWSDFQRAYSQVISATSDRHRPWHIVPSDHKWYRDWAIMSLVVRELRDMDPHYPTKVIDGVEQLAAQLRSELGT